MTKQLNQDAWSNDAAATHGSSVADAPVSDITERARSHPGSQRIPDRPPQGRSLSAVIARIPAECYQKPTATGIAYLCRDLAMYLASVTGLFLTDDIRLLIPLWFLAALSISALFVVGHDAAHGSLFEGRRLSYAISQLCMFPALHLHSMWCHGHNRIHHGHTTRENMDYVWHPLTPQQYSQLTPLGKLTHRVKWSCLGAGIYYLVDIWWQRMVLFSSPDKIKPQVRRERIGVFSGFAVLSGFLLWGGSQDGGAALLGIWTWTKVFLIPFLLWNYSIGIVVYAQHISPDIAWRSHRTWNRFAAQMQGTSVLHIPMWLNFFYHNIFLHVPHHVDMRVPFYHLPAATAALRKHFGSLMHERPYDLRSYVATTRICKLFDFDLNVWYDYQGRSRS